MRRISLLMPILLILSVSVAWAGAAYTVYVSPPSGGDDTTALQGALDTCMQQHPTGCTIQLAAGTYKSTQLIAENFNGSLQGMGMDLTTIEVLAPLEVTVSTENVFDQPPSRTNKYPLLITFLSGDITVSDFKVTVNDFNPATPWCYGSSGCGQTWLKGLVGVYSTVANLFVTRMDFEGGPGTNDGRNYDNGPFFFGTFGAQPVPLTGTFKLTSTHCRYAGNCWEVFGVRNSNITIGGSPSRGIVVEDGELGGLMGDIDHSLVEYSYNHVAVSDHPYAGFVLFQGVLSMPQELSQFVVQHNMIQATGGYEDGILIVDNGPFLGVGKKADVLITDNTIQLGGSAAGPAYAGVESVFAVDAVISNNRISGANALFGISAEADTQCMLKGNNVQQLQPLFIAVALLGANSGFPFDTNGCTVIGGNNKVNVYDEGTNDILVGVNNMGNPPGPAVKQAMQEKRDLLKSWHR